MSVESLNPKSNEILANRAKGIARQVLNLVNQTLFDGAKDNATFSAILESQQSETSQVIENPIQQKLKQDDTQESQDIEVNPKSLEKPKTTNKEDIHIQIDRQREQILEAKVELDSEEKAPELLENQEVSEPHEALENDKNAEIISTIIQGTTVVQTELAAATTLSQSQTSIENTVVSIPEEAEQTADQSEQLAAANTATPENAEIPQDIADKIKQLKSQEQRLAHATKNDDNHGQNVKELVHNRNDLRKEESVADLAKNLDNSPKIENFHANKIAQDKAQLAANLQQFVTQSSTKDVLLSNTSLVEHLKHINPENISSIKAANTAIKIGSDNLSLSVTKPGAITSASANSQMAAFKNPDYQDLGQKLENSKNSKPLTKSQLISTMEKVEAVLKKIADSKDGSTISLRLDPPQLGSVRADVSLKDGVLHARLTAENAQVLQLLRDRASDLQVTLRKMGLDVEKVSISVNSSDLGTFSGDAEDRQGKNGTRQGSFFSAQADFAESTDSNILDHWIA